MLTSEQHIQIGRELMKLGMKGDLKQPIQYILAYCVTSLRLAGIGKDHIHNMIEADILVADKAIEESKAK